MATLSELLNRLINHDPKVSLDWTSKNTFRITESVYSDSGHELISKEFKVEELHNHV